MHTYLSIYIYMCVVCLYRNCASSNYKTLEKESNIGPVTYFDKVYIYIYVYIYLYIYIERERGGGGGGRGGEEERGRGGGGGGGER